MKHDSKKWLHERLNSINETASGTHMNQYSGCIFFIARYQDIQLVSPSMYI